MPIIYYSETNKVISMIKVIKTFFSAVLFGTLFFMYSSQAAEQKKSADPQSLVNETVEHLLITLRNKRSQIEKHPDQIYNLVEAIVLPHFDFDRMSKLVLAKHWKAATEGQKQRFIEQFRALIVRTYALSLLDYTDEKVRYLPMRGELKKRKVTVRTEVIKPGGGKALPIEYNMYLPADAWKVYDVKVDGVSLVLNYRKTYHSKIKQLGLDVLIEEMSQKSNESMQPQS